MNKSQYLPKHKSPCRKDCEKRSRTCHAECEAYKEYYNKNRENGKKAIANGIIDSFKMDSVNKQMKQNRSKR